MIAADSFQLYYKLFFRKQIISFVSTTCVADACDMMYNTAIGNVHNLKMKMYKTFLEVVVPIVIGNQLPVVETRNNFFFKV